MFCKVRAALGPGKPRQMHTHIHIHMERLSTCRLGCRLRKQEASRRLFANLSRAQVDLGTFRRLSLSLFDGGRITRLTAENNNGRNIQNVDGSTERKIGLDALVVSFN